MKPLSVLAILAAVSVVHAQTGEVPDRSAGERIRKADYVTAARFAPSRIMKLVDSIEVQPNWLKHSDRFWYAYTTSAGRSWHLADPEKGAQRPLFDNDKLAAQLALTMHDAFDAHNLPLQELEFIDADRKVRFEVKSSQVDEAEKAREEAKHKAKVERAKAAGEKPPEPLKKDFKKIFGFEYELASGELRHLADYHKLKDDLGWTNFSPDERVVLYGKGFDLYWMDAENYAKAQEDEDDPSIVEHRLTDDGEEHYDYFGVQSTYAQRLKSDAEAQQMKQRVRVRALWSHDSSRFAVVRYDRRKVQQLWVIDPLARPRPTLTSYAYAMAGDENAGEASLWVFDMNAQKGRQIDVSAFAQQELQLLSAPRPAAGRTDRRQPMRWLSASPDRLFLYRVSRDMKRVDLLRVDASSGAVKVLVEERFNTPNDFEPPQLIGDGREFIFWSERNGWAHLYRYNADGELLNAVTRGIYHVADVARVDERNRVLYFTAYGREPDENPYYAHFYRVNFDGSGLRLLDPGNFSHKADICDSARYFVDNYSRVDTAPRAEVRDSNGKVLMTLQEADLSRLVGAGFRFPETFTVKADDGITDLYGVMYKPFNFDPSKKYPLLAYVYPGPQTESVDSAFMITRTGRISQSTMSLPGMAQFGYIVVSVGNRGGHPRRSRAYQDFSYNSSFRDYGLADKKTAVEQLAARHDFIDIERMGIFGHSGGGFMSTAAMLVYPDFFKAAVSSSGNHVNSIYSRWWSERYNGLEEVTDEEGNVTFKFAVTENDKLARNLKGHLLLVTGAVDDNVHPANTYRMAEALINAGKRFDMLVLPGGAHGYVGKEWDYFFWARADHFNRYLIGDAPDSVDIVDMNREYPQTQE